MQTVLRTYLLLFPLFKEKLIRRLMWRMDVSLSLMKDEIVLPWLRYMEIMINKLV